MEGIAAARTRIEAIRARFDSLTPRQDFAAVLAGHTTAAESAAPKAAPEEVATLPVPDAPAPTVPAVLTSAAPLAATDAVPGSTTTPPIETPGLMTAAATVTLGTMTGTGTPLAPLPPPATDVITRAELDAYLDRHRIEQRNGRLGAADLVTVSGAWKGRARLLPPAAAAWEAMRAAAAADGIDLRAVDTYRSWESQSRAYTAYRRGEKSANVLPPGRSEHGEGLAVDVTNGHIVGPGDPEWAWLRINARRFGWYPISNESWHWEFRGV